MSFEIKNCKPVVQAFLGSYELFRLMGFTPDDLYMHRNPDGECFLLVKQSDKMFSLTLGHDDGTEDEIRKLVTAAGEAASSGEIPEADMTAIVVGTRMLLGDREGLLQAIRNRGIVIPTPERYR